MNYAWHTLSFVPTPPAWRCCYTRPWNLHILQSNKPALVHRGLSFSAFCICAWLNGTSNCTKLYITHSYHVNLCNDGGFSVVNFHIPRKNDGLWFFISLFFANIVSQCFCVAPLENVDCMAHQWLWLCRIDCSLVETLVQPGVCHHGLYSVLHIAKSEKKNLIKMSQQQ